ncbi:MAG: RagB/SusD family nutrient uptake outer membrane protein, partial [Bacteroidales bacterium]|nr:RagB/SusD family nutrient uptake outer membrane protein [Bacteroidales bacterium]
MKKIVLILIPVLGILSACNSYLDMTPKDSISDKVMWSSTESAEYAVNSIYSYAYDIYASLPSSVGMTEAFTDEFKYGSYVNFAYCLIPSQVAYGGTTLTNSFVSVYLGCWGTLYEAIRRTNEAISNLHTLGSGLPEEDQTRLEGELRLMRGWLYFELVKRYKDVILYDEDLSQIAVDKALSSETEGWDFIWKDLDYAAGVLPARQDAKGRLDKGVALALITRAMLYAGEYDRVIEAADELESLGYSLMADYAKAFTVPVQEGNTETILQY